MHVALDQARALAASALGGYAAIKAMTEDREALRAALRREAETQMKRAQTWEHAEGVAAFKDKRRPDYVGLRLTHADSGRIAPSRLVGTAERCRDRRCRIRLRQSDPGLTDTSGRSSGKPRFVARVPGRTV